MDSNDPPPPKRCGPNHPRTVKARISALVWDLRFFDVTTIEHAGDPKAKALAVRINSTLADIFGRNSKEYKDCSVRTFHTAPSAPDSGYPLTQMRQEYQKGINGAIRKLGLLFDSIGKNPGATGRVTRSARRAGRAVEGPDDGKVSLVTMRAKLKSRPVSFAVVTGASPRDGTRVKRKPTFGAANGKLVDLHVEATRPEDGTAGTRDRGRASVHGKSSRKEKQPKAAKGKRGGKKRKLAPPAFGGPENVILNYIEERLRASQAEGPEEKKRTGKEPEASAPLPARVPLEGESVKKTPVPADEAMVPGNDDLPAADASGTSTEESLPFAPIRESPDIAKVEGPSVSHPESQSMQETAPWNPAGEVVLDASARHPIGPSDAPASFLPRESFEVTATAPDENDLCVTLPSFDLDEGRMGDTEGCLSGPGVESVSEALPSGPLGEKQAPFEDGPSPDGTVEGAAEPLWHEVMAHELLSVGEWAGNLERRQGDTGRDAVEDEQPAARREKTSEPTSTRSLDLRDIEALADKFAKEMGGPSLPKGAGATEKDLSGSPVSTPAGVITAPEVDQNPFAIKDFEKKQGRPRITGAVDVRVQIRAIMARIDDLKGFDVSAVTERFDPGARELREAVNHTIGEVFGRNTRAYWHHSLPSFDAIPVVLGSPKPSPAEVRDFYRHGIDKAVKKLTAIVESLKQKIGQPEFRDSGGSSSRSPRTKD